MNSVIEKYFAAGNFCRTDLADDISRLRISRDDLATIVNSSEIQKYYFSSIDLKIIDKTLWTSEYLQNLTSKSVAECFTKQYLLYLFDVSIYLNNKAKIKSKRTILFCSLLFVVSAFILSSFFILKARKDKSQNLSEKLVVTEESTEILENTDVLDLNFESNSNQEFGNEQ